MILKPIPVRPELKSLMAKASEHVMTPAEIYEQRISWTYGNLAIENPDITKEMVREEARRMYGPSPEPADAAALVRARGDATHQTPDSGAKKEL